MALMNLHLREKKWVLVLLLLAAIIQGLFLKFGRESDWIAMLYVGVRFGLLPLGCLVVLLNVVVDCLVSKRIKAIDCVVIIACICGIILPYSMLSVGFE